MDKENNLKEELTVVLQEWVEKLENTETVYKDSLKELNNILNIIEKFEIDNIVEESNCDCFKICERPKAFYDRLTGRAEIEYTEKYGICMGTCEKDEVYCNGDKCSVYCLHKEKRA